MIRITQTHKGNLLGTLVAYLSSFQENVNQTLDEVVQEVQPTLLDELAYTPPERDASQVLDWTSEQQRKAFFASGGFGGGIPHVRTGALPEGWIVTSSNGKLLIANNILGALYLYGSLSKGNPGAHQQAFLAAIGWIPAYQTVYTWTGDIAAEVVKRIREQFGDMGSVNASTRAYTRL